MPVEITWYGERGIINALSVALKLAGTGAIREFLDAIIWANGGQPEWIAQITEAKLIVEVGLGQFGDPDLIIIRRTDESLLYAVFVEAKVVGYLVNAMSISDGMRRGFNSSINGQLSLKYRFARALSAWNGLPHHLREPQDLFNAYQQAPIDGGLGDRNGSPRKLAKRSVLRILQQHGLSGVPFNHVHFVGLTWDRNPFFNLQDFGASAFRPLFLDEQGAETWEDPQTRAQVGWLGYAAIDGLVTLARYLNGEYREARATMLSQTQPRGPAAPPGQKIPPIIPYSIEQNSNDTTRLTLAGIIAAATTRFGESNVEPSSGSVSIKPLGKVLLKFVPQNPGPTEHIVFGVSASLERQDLGGFNFPDLRLIGVSRNAQQFYTRELPQQREEAVGIADAVFETLAEMLDLNSVHKEPQ
jgi:hypothetical protein